MKKIFLTIFHVLFWISLCQADIVDDGMPAGTPENLKDSTRQLIQAGVKSADAVSMTRAMLENHFSVESALQAHQIIMNARQQGLPVKPLENKVFEGMTKNVRPDRIVRAMEDVLSRFAYAYDRAALLSNQHAQISRLADALAAALAAGLNNRDAAKICGLIQDRTQNMNSGEQDELASETLITARDVARLSVASQDVTEVVVQALQRGFDADQMKSMRSSFLSISRSIAPRELAQNYAKALQQGRGFHGFESSGAKAGHGGAAGSGGSGGARGAVPGAPAAGEHPEAAAAEDPEAAAGEDPGAAAAEDPEAAAAEDPAEISESITTDGRNKYPAIQQSCKCLIPPKVHMSSSIKTRKMIPGSFCGLLNSPDISDTGIPVGRLTAAGEFSETKPVQRFSVFR